MKEIWKRIQVSSDGSISYYSPIPYPTFPNPYIDRVILRLSCGHTLIAHMKVQTLSDFVYGSTARCLICESKQRRI